MDNDLKLWKKAADFHGHTCGGLTIGYKASLLASELLDLNFSEDEDVVCITENDACGVDAIQAILGCSVGKGNLLFKIRGKQAFSFFNKKTKKSIRIVLKDIKELMGKPDATKDQVQEFMFNSDPKTLFDIKEVRDTLPENARIFTSIKCDCCGELTADYLLRLQEGKKLCLDCFKPYERFID